MGKASDPLRVVKKLAPAQPGAIKLGRRYGDALVCVRYRHDSNGQYRYTTVELVIERTPIQRRPDRVVGVRINFGEKSLQASAKAGGATWDSTFKLWRMPHRLASRLGLLERVREK
ncbi:MAG: hypothetical protein ACREXI_03665 [Caldimonas sp.]